MGKKHFNIAGPCIPGQHYMLPPLERTRELGEFIEDGQYIVLHAARQSGKTTLLKELTRQLNVAGEYYAVYCSLESLQGISDAQVAIPAIVRNLKTEIEFHEQLTEIPFAPSADYDEFTLVLRKSLTLYCRRLDKPLIIFFDEADCLSNGALIVFLRQLREGYVNRGTMPFVHAVALVGMRNIRDYKSKIREDRETLGSASPFNIVTEALTLSNFTRSEIIRLYAQHTEQTGQEFSPEAVERAFELTQGQPWLVNAIARDILVNQLQGDTTATVLPEHVDAAAQTIILRRPTHIDSLMERLKEERVRRIVEPVILGETRGYDSFDDDYQYVLDLGLLRVGEHRRLMPSNPMYAEVIIRTLSSRSQMEMEQRQSPPEASAYMANGRLDMRRVLEDFQAFWRENSAIWVERFEYKEAAPHLVLQAFLQRVINGGGSVTREMASGRERLDLCVHYQGGRYPIELKIRYSEQTYAQGQDQLAEYLDTLGCDQGWLLVFDRRPNVAWDEKIFWRTTQRDGKTIHIVGC